MRDTHKLAVYGAEHEVRALLDRGGSIEMHGSVFEIPDTEIKFGRPQDAQRYVDRVLALYAPDAPPVRVRTRNGQAAAHYQMGTIALPPYVNNRAWALREIVVLHELSHHLTRYTAASHGPEFTGTFVRLVSQAMNPLVGWLLHTTYLANGVPVDSQLAMR